MAALAMSHGGDFSKSQELFWSIENDDSLKELLVLNPSDEVGSILTGAAFASSKEEAIRVYQSVKNGLSLWGTNRTPAVLTLATILNQGDMKTVLDAYSQVNNHNFESTLGFRDITENAIAVLALAAVIDGSVTNTLDMYDYSRKADSLSINTSVRLVLSTIASKEDLSMIARTGSYVEQVGKTVITRETIVPLLLAAKK